MATMQHKAPHHRRQLLTRLGASLWDPLPRQIQLHPRPNPGWAGRHDNTLRETLRLQVLLPREALGLGFFFSPPLFPFEVVPPILGSKG